jgi:hypothetical protein
MEIPTEDFSALPDNNQLISIRHALTGELYLFSLYGVFCIAVDNKNDTAVKKDDEIKSEPSFYRSVNFG